MSQESEVRIVARMLTDPTVVSYIGIVGPPAPGVREFFTRLEYDLFPPDTPENDAFQLTLVSFEGIIFTVAFIPAIRSRAADEIADRLGLRPSMTIPVFIKNGGLEKFPVANERSRTLEHRPGHDAYKNDPDLFQKLLREETTRIDAIVAEYSAAKH